MRVTDACCRASCDVVLTAGGSARMLDPHGLALVTSLNRRMPGAAHEGESSWCTSGQASHYFFQRTTLSPP
jgi:hypothetical protein